MRDEGPGSIMNKLRTWNDTVRPKKDSRVLRILSLGAASRLSMTFMAVRVFDVVCVNGVWRSRLGLPKLGAIVVAWYPCVRRRDKAEIVGAVAGE